MIANKEHCSQLQSMPRGKTILPTTGFGRKNQKDIIKYMIIKKKVLVRSN